MIGPIARRQERGVTIVLMAVCLMALLAMAALAIDVVSLYVASTQAQRAADAAALAGARAFASSGYTSAPTTWTTADLCQSSGPGAAAAANKQAEAVAAQNLVSGQAAAVQTIACDFTNPGNPQLTVTVQRTGLPTFFARIWGASASSVSASSTAEAYNASGSSAPIQISAVKPWLLPNCDPYHTVAAGGNVNCPVAGGNSDYFVSPADGSILNSGSFIGQMVDLRYTGNNPPVQPTVDPSPPTIPPVTRYYRLDIPINPPTAVCPATSAPSCGQVGSIDYLDNIACSSTQPFRCGDTVTALTNAGLGNRTREGTRCLIHADNDGVCQNQDYFGSNCGDTIASNPATITGGGNNPNPSLQGVTNISRSDSLATVPLYDGHNLCAAGCTTATIVGFLQLGLTYTSGAGPSSLVHGVILNASGCNPGASGTAVAGGGISPVPVRLIHQ